MEDNNTSNSKSLASGFSSRRTFLKKLGLSLGAAGAITSVNFLSSCSADGTGEKVKVMTADGQMMEVDKNQLSVDTKEITKRGREGLPGRKFVMVIDLAKCRNARKCMTACQSAHDLRPEQHHINVLRMQNDEKTSPYFMPKPCQHCDNPPCTKVCPVDATFQRQDGIVLIDNERCIGCRFCIAACPYSARIFHWQEPKLHEEYQVNEEKYDQMVAEGKEDEAKVFFAENIAYDVELNTPQKKGTISKCLFSADQLRLGKLPYCVSACDNSVYWFGDANEDVVTNGTSGETVRLSTLLKDNDAYTLMPELGTKPSVYYLPAKDRLFDYEFNEDDDPANANKEHHG